MLSNFMAKSVNFCSCSWTYSEHTLFSLCCLDSNNKLLSDWHSRGNTLQTFREWLCILYTSPTECSSTLLFWRVRPLHRHYIHVFGQWSRQWQQGINMVFYICAWEVVLLHSINIPKNWDKIQRNTFQTRANMKT